VAGFIGASAILHALCFYVFQVVYPASVALLPPPARVTLIAANSEEGRTLLHWVDAEDPALASATVRPPESRLRALPKVQHVASYATEEPKLKPIPPLVLATRAPSSQPPGPVPMKHEPATAAPAPAPTRVQVSEELADLGPINLAPGHFAASTNESPQNLRFRIAVNSRGEIRHCFPVNSSGNPALDGQALQQLVLSRFPKPTAPTKDDESELRWGIAIFEWGNDVTGAQASPKSEDSNSGAQPSQNENADQRKSAPSATPAP
jgi:hypothetical protein